MMGRSDNKPVLGPFEVSKLTKKVAFIWSVEEQFWDTWSTSYLQWLSHYQKWRNVKRNVEPGDVVFILEFVKVKSDGLECRIIMDANYFRIIKNLRCAMLSNSIELDERFKTLRAGLKVLTTSSKLF